MAASIRIYVREGGHSAEGYGPNSFADERMNRQRGATLVLTALALAALLGAAALATDLAVIYGARRRAQEVADAAALAGGQLLPNTARATAAATAIIAANNADGGRSPRPA